MAEENSSPEYTSHDQMPGSIPRQKSAFPLDVKGHIGSHEEADAADVQGCA